tara:strand:+ start:325 stop:567 length:243 start_codon:yes stop_codon:yes gene_type:complete
MVKVMKESFFEANIRVDEEFDSAAKAHLSNKPDFNRATVKILDLKFDMSRIKNKLKEQDVRSQSYKSIKGSAIGGIKKDV